MLHCKETPHQGAETLFADSARMFERLSQEQQDWATQAVGVFSNRFTAGGPAAFDAAFGLRMDPTGCALARQEALRRGSSVRIQSPPLSFYVSQLWPSWGTPSPNKVNISREKK